MIVIDEDGLIQAFGKVAQRMFGYAEDEVIGRNVAMLMAAPHQDRHDSYLRHYLETGEKRIIGSSRLENARHADGHLFPVELSITEVYIDELRCFVGFLRDLAQSDGERRQVNTMLTDLAHASRVSAMGALATALAHELNQPLTSIANYTESLRDLLAKRTDVDGVEEYVRILDTCSRQAIRAGQLIHRLREFIKGGEPKTDAIRVDRLVDEAISLALINGFKRNVIIDTDIAPDLSKVLVDPLHGQQVLFNLIRNAFEAMDAEHTDHHRILISARSCEDEQIEFAVEDSGSGIDPDVRDSLFQGFVTTKEGGMGVGLAISKQIVESYGGRITSDHSAKLGGAMMRFTLPAASPDQQGEG